MGQAENSFVVIKKIFKSFFKEHIYFFLNTFWFFWFVGGLENPRSSVIGLFRRESLGFDHFSSSESTPQKERRGSLGRNAVLLIEEDTDPLGVLQKVGTTPILPQPPQTPGQRSQARRGSMLELSGCVDTDDLIDT